MIRPFTFLCMVGALGSGLYLYQCKHQAQVLDREIARTIKQTEAARDRIGMLRAEWTQLNQPDRVSDLARAHTTLQTAKPTQFVSASDLAAKLPAAVMMPPPAPLQPTDVTPEDVVPAAQAEPPTPKPVSLKPELKPVADAPGRPAEPPRVAEARRPDAKPDADAEPKPDAKVEPRAEVKPVRQAAAATRSPVAPHAPAHRAATEPSAVTASVLTPRRDPAPVAPYVQPVLAPAYVSPASAGPAYAGPSYPAPAYPTSYAPAPAGSVLGGSRGLPPPVPFAAR